MARTQAPSRSTSARRVTLLAQGMRPLTVTAPCFRRSSASVNDMPIAAAADVTAGIHGLAAHGAIGAAALHEFGGAGDEGLRLLARDAHAGGSGLLTVAHTERGHDPRGLREVEQVHLGRHRALGRAQLGDEPGEIVAQRLHLALLALERDDGVSLAHLQVEDALARLADGSRGEEIRLLEVERLAHLMPTRVRSPSMEFTVRAALLDTP